MVYAITRACSRTPESGDRARSNSHNPDDGTPTAGIEAKYEKADYMRVVVVTML